jgi:NAD(P)-dependent dehydrogenase (short-subunit alcohol dehydrogenase family)
MNLSSDKLQLTVNAAMTGRPVLGLEATLEDMHTQFNVGVFVPLRMIQATIPHMPRGGRVINIGSIASKLGIHGSPVYNASKAALDSLTFSLAKEVSCTSPSCELAD